jgi:CBS domain-containing protein
MQVENILQIKGRDVVTITSGQTIAEAVELLNTHRIGALVVLEGSRVVGILSERDVVRHLGNDWAGLASRAVADMMGSDPVTVTPQSSVAEVMETMTNRRVRHLPVLDRGELVGIVSIGDVVKRKIEEAEFETSALKKYIAS